jgi:hypothetical protein
MLVERLVILGQALKVVKLLARQLTSIVCSLPFHLPEWGLMVVPLLNVLAKSLYFFDKENILISRRYQFHKG